MSIIWCGGEDVDFDSNLGPLPLLTAEATSYQRGSISTAIGAGMEPVNPISQLFTRQTSGWVSAMVNNVGGYSYRAFGLHDSENNKTLIISTLNSTSLELFIFSSGTYYSLGSVLNALLIGSQLININVISLGASSSINIYTQKMGGDGLAFAYTGNLSSYNFTGYDSIKIFGAYNIQRTSQIIVANEDTRSMRLVTLSPDANGNTQDWSGSYTDIDESNLTKSDKIYTSTADKDAQFNLTTLPGGINAKIKAVRIAYCAMARGVSLELKAGIRSESTNSLGTAQALNNYWENKQILYDINPVTGVPFTMAEIESLQLAFRSE